MKLDADTFEAMSLEGSSWPVNERKDKVAMALDDAHQRLFLAGRGGVTVIVDTESGRELQTLYRQNSPDNYTSLGSIRSAPASAERTPSILAYEVQ